MWLSEVPAGATLHTIDITKALASSVCGSVAGVLVSDENSNCPACKEHA